MLNVHSQHKRQITDLFLYNIREVRLLLIQEEYVITF